MRRNQNSLWTNLLMISGVMALAAGSAFAEQIRFSKPTVAIVAPLKHEEKLPETEDQSFNFRNDQLPQGASVYIPPVIVRVAPKEKPEETEKATSEEKANPFDALNNRSRNPTFRDLFKPQEPQPGAESSLSRRMDNNRRALAPVTDFNWDPRANERRLREEAVPNRLVNQRALNAENYGGGFMETFGAANKDQLNRAQMERRVAFENMLNPSAAATRPASSLSPVSSFEPPRNQALNQGQALANRRLPETAGSDPMRNFNARQSQLRGPLVEDVNEKYNNKRPPSAPSPTVQSPYFQTPLNRLPSIQEFPTRKGL